jgi:hypothetical protein
MKNKSTGFVFLYNGLYAISSKYSELAHLESPIFEVMDEIESCIYTGFNQSALENYKQSGVQSEVVHEIGKFGEFVLSINSENWNPHNFENDDDWQLARKWAESLLDKIGMERSGWNDGNTKIIYLGRIN